jgi:benzoyl-CoA reductase/2-hydroxyglutaryl-CoA dehydratase subunit BcrC/BadD/HgdB
MSGEPRRGIGGRAIRRAQYEGAARVVAPALATFLRAQRRMRSLRRGKKAPSELFGPPLQTTHRLKEVLTRHYLSGRYADGAVPVAWVTSGFPVEFLRPFGYHVVYPENHAAMCGVQRQGVELAETAEAWGIPRDTCGYARCDIGSWLSGKTPAGRLPKPDILLACTNICQTVVHWYRTLGQIMGVPVFVVDTPFLYDEPDERTEAYVARQLEECLHVCARVAGRNLDMGELGHVARISKEASELWGECLALSQTKPAPWTGFDQFLHLGPIVAMRGLPECNAYYRELRDELRDRVGRGIGAVRNERHRLLWDNLPIWYELRSLSELLAEQGFNIVAATYSNGWAETAPLFDPQDPIRSAARVYSRVFINRSVAYRLRLMKDLSAAYDCDGAILHSNHSCKPYSVGQIDLADRLAKEASIRTLVLDGDHIDMRVHGKEQTEGRVSAFMESFGGT